VIGPRGGRRPKSRVEAQVLSNEDVEARLGGTDHAAVGAAVLTHDEAKARLGVPLTALTRVRHARGASQPESARYVTTRRRILWRDSATILIGIVLALLAVRFVLPSGPAATVGSPSPQDTGLGAVGSSTPSSAPLDTPPPTLGLVVPPSLHLDATPTPIPVITLPPATPRPTPTLRPKPT
jgi:hypothetical protein